MQPNQKIPAIGLGSDHRGFDLKSKLANFLKNQAIQVIDFGTYNKDPVDYPDIAIDVAESIQTGLIEKGILICGTGLGMAITANKIPGIFAAPVWAPSVSKLAKQSNNAQIISLGADHIDFSTACEICLIWLEAGFRGGRSERKVKKIHQLEKRYMHQ